MTRPGGEHRLALVCLGAAALASAGILGWIVITAVAG